MIQNLLKTLHKKLCISIDRKKLLNLFIGVIMIYFTFMIGGILHQYILKQKYINRSDNTLSLFTNPQGLITVQKMVVFSFGLVYNLSFLPKQNRVKIPAKNSIICAFFIFLSSLTNNYAIIMVSYPIVVMFKSCNILSVILVGVICSRVKSKGLKLQGKKIIGAIAVTAGMIMFKLFDPEAKKDDQRKIQIFGLVLLVISLFADGFLPDFQAQIKQKFKPQPTIMLVEINKWCAILSLAYCILTGNFMSFIDFSWSHPLFVVHLLSMAALSFIGHIFIYKMIKEFRQHIVPFVITTRKIISVGISMMYFHHPSSPIQIVCIFVVLSTTLYEFLREIVNSKKQEKIKPAQLLEIVEENFSQKSQNFSQMHEDSQNSDRKTQQKIDSSQSQNSKRFNN